MSRAPARTAAERLDPEKVAYWYFRLNGFFQIENFVIHSERRGGQRTDADLLAIRFPFRAERLFDDSNDIMADDAQHLALSGDLIDVVVVEVIRKRCEEGIERAKTKGTKFGRPSSLDPSQRRRIAERYSAGETMAALAREYDCGEATIWRALQ